MQTLKSLGPGLLAGLAAMVLLTAKPAAATPLPPGVAAMIAAAASDPATLKTVVTVAKKANPTSTAEIDAQVASLSAKAEVAKAQRLATQSFYEGWDGKGQIGLYSHTGNTDDGGIAVGVNLDRDGLRWRHIITLLADYQQENGKATKEKYSAGYEGDYKVTKRFYAYGVLYGEQDIFASIQSRFSESLGVGYRFIDRKTMTLGLEAGPAIRQTAYIGAPSLDTVDVRLAGDFSWTFWDNTTFTQTAWTYVEHRNPTLTASTAVTTRLQKGVSARASFDVTHEGDPAPGREKTDTTSRLTLVFSF
jgi:putative salt-induced outer membrane protein